LLGTVGVFAVWSLAAPLNRGATASGKLETSGGRTLIKSFDGGVIRAVLVTPGQKVVKDQPLVQFDIDQARLALSQLEAQRDRLTIDLAMYQAEVQGRSNLILPEGFTPQTPIMDAYLQVQGAALRARQTARRSQKAVLGEQSRRQMLQAQSLRAQLSSQDRQIASITSEEADVRSLYEKGYAPKQRVLTLERNSESLQSTKEQTATALIQTSASMRELGQQSAQIDAEAVLLAAQRLAEAQGMLSEVNDKITAQRLMIQRGELLAPVAGTVLSTTVSGPGSVVRSGETILELVPSTTLIVKAQVKPVDIDHVRVGSPVRLKFSGLNVQTTPTLHGRVTFVAADTSVDERSRADFYEVKVEVPAAEQSKIKGVNLSAGMPVEVMIDAGSRSAIAYLLQPIIKTYDRSFRE
jgi:HlyD family type I secretion membrane fusion protein